MVDDRSVETWTLDDGTKLTLRHIAPDDAAREQAFVRKLSVQSRYLRFHGSIKELNKGDLEKMTNPDPATAEALIILTKGENDEEEIGVARYIMDLGGKSGEFAVVVADEWQKRGLGSRLMKVLLSHAGARGIEQIHGTVLTNNSDMLQFAKKLGFEETTDPNDDTVVTVVKNLGE